MGERSAIGGRRDKLIAECVARRDQAVAEAVDSRRYAAWMRSAEGKAHRGQWIGRPESSDDDAASNEEEAQFWADLLEAIR